MLNSGEKKIALFATKKINILTLVLSEKKILNKTKNHNPPFKLNGRSLNKVKKKSVQNYFLRDVLEDQNHLIFGQL